MVYVNIDSAAEVDNGFAGETHTSLRRRLKERSSLGLAAYLGSILIYKPDKQARKIVQEETKFHAEKISSDMDEQRRA